MATDLDKIKNELLALPIQSRASLAQSLIESLDPFVDPDVDTAEIEAAWIEEVRRRDAEIRNGTAECKPADQVLEEARERLRCSK
ncbi:MAG TPA: addiction module protein [Blastocatellia bacterium]|nr:addiction module protein [Blastocatellia bacterium]